MIVSIWHVLLELAPWLLLGTAVAAVMHGLLPVGFVRRQLRGWSGVFKAVAIGVPLPLCSCGVIPAGLGLKRDGASNGASVGFLISTPQTGVDSILVSASFLGWPFALFKVGSALLTGVIGGMLADFFSSPDGGDVKSEEDASSESSRNLRGMIEHGVQVLRSIWAWLVLGVVVSAAIEVFVPAQALSVLSAYGGLGAALAMLVISVPMYVCATASVPIAAALVAAGMPTGAALVFLMAGPATNVATIGAVYRGFGGRTLMVYLLTIIVGSVGLGMAFEFVVSSGEAPALHSGHDSWLATISAVALLASFAFFAWEDLRRWLRVRQVGALVAERVSVPVAGMTCGGCVRRLEGHLSAVPAVESVVVTLEPGRAVVTGSLDRADLAALVESAGFSVGETALTTE